MTTNATSFRRAQATTLQGGIVGKVAPGFALFTGYNESFQPNNSLDTAGRQLPNLEGHQFEAGIKAQLLQDRLRMTAAYFDIHASTSRAAPPGRPIGAVDFASQISKGFDTDISLSLSRNLEAIVTFAKFDLTDSTTVSFPNVSETTSSAWLRYAWTKGVLKGFVLGGGANYQSARDGTAGPNRDGTGTVFDSAANNFANVTFHLPGRTIADFMIATSGRRGVSRSTSTTYLIRNTSIPSVSRTPCSPATSATRSSAWLTASNLNGGRAGGCAR